MFGRIFTILFDLDGTLTDPRIGIVRCFQYALEKMKLPTWQASALTPFIGPPLRDGFAKILASTDEGAIDQAVVFYRERYQAVGMYENKVYDGVYDLLDRLVDNGHLLFVATSKAEPYALQILNHFRLAAYFKKIYGSQMGGTFSDKTKLIEHLLKQEALLAENAFMVGDRKYDVLAALHNGLAPIGALWGYGSRAELVSAGATLLCETPARVFDTIRL